MNAPRNVYNIWVNACQQQRLSPTAYTARITGLTEMQVLAIVTDIAAEDARRTQLLEQEKRKKETS